MIDSKPDLELAIEGFVPVAVFYDRRYSVMGIAVRVDEDKETLLVDDSYRLQCEDGTPIETFSQLRVLQHVFILRNGISINRGRGFYVSLLVQ